MYQKEDSLGLLSENEERQKKAAELRQQLMVEVNLTMQKYQQVFDEYRPAHEEMQRIVIEFNKRWDPVIASYKKELKAIEAKYKRLAKEL